MNIDELARSHGTALRDAYESAPASQLVRPPGRGRPGRRLSAPLVGLAALAITLAVFLPIAMQSGSPNPGSAPVAISPSSTVPSEADVVDIPLPVVSLGEPLWQRTGDQVELGPIVDTGTELLVNGTQNTHAAPWPVFTLTSVDNGASWTQVWEEPGFDMFGPVATDGTQILAKATGSSGDSSALYRWDPAVPGWEPVSLPLPYGAVQAGAQLAAFTARGWLVVGVATPTDFDDRMDVVAWRSGDGIDWETETIAEDIGGGFYGGHIIDSAAGDVVLGFARIGDSADASGVPHPLVFQATTTGVWEMTDLTDMVYEAGQIDWAMENLQLVDALMINNELVAWWRLSNAREDSLQERRMVVTRSTSPTQWTATATTGPLPGEVVASGGVLYAIEKTPGQSSAAPADSVLLKSEDGVDWRPIGRIAGVFIRQLKTLGPDRLIATGNIFEEGNEQSTAGGIWTFAPPKSE